MRLLDRRNFFRRMVGGLAATAAVRTWPFRVYSFPTDIISFPTDIIVPELPSTLFDQITVTTLAHLREDILYDNFFIDTPFMEKLRKTPQWEEYEISG